MPLEAATIEHWVARCHGGGNELANLALAHWECNQAVDNLSVMEKIQIRELIMEILPKLDRPEDFDIRYFCNIGERKTHRQLVDA